MSHQPLLCLLWCEQHRVLLRHGQTPIERIPPSDKMDTHTVLLSTSSDHIPVSNQKEPRTYILHMLQTSVRILPRPPPRTPRKKQSLVSWFEGRPRPGREGYPRPQELFEPKKTQLDPYVKAGKEKNPCLRKSQKVPSKPPRKEFQGTWTCECLRGPKSHVQTLF